MKPIIGITPDLEKDDKHFLRNDYMQAIIRAGGLPFIIPIGHGADIAQVVDLLDGLLLTGGKDINPILFNEEPHTHLGEVSPSRDLFELELARQMLVADKPILGICRGLQLLNVAVGGTLYQDLHRQNEGPMLQHLQKSPNTHPSHFVQLAKGSLLAGIADSERIQVNSFHHQALRDVPSMFKISGRASDGVIEAVESKEKDFVLGVQWHPELLATKGDAISLQIFDRFVGACVKKD